MGDFGLSAALGEDGTAELVRRQRRIARQYGEAAVVDRMTAWLMENGHEAAGSVPDHTETDPASGLPDAPPATSFPDGEVQ